MTTIERYHLRRLSLTPGRELPSRLADIKELPVILIEAETADGTTGFADTMLIEGITPETPDQGWIIACKLAEVTAGMRCAEADAFIANSHAVAPGATSALRLAIENTKGGDLVTDGRHDLVAKFDPMETFPEKAQRVRLSLSGDVEADLALIAEAQSAVSGGWLRLDGDQAFNTEDAVRLAAALDPAGIEWLDQPCIAGDWEAAAAVKAETNVATMVSGFLFTPQDLETAAAMSAADFVGLRLGQSGGRQALVEMCQISAELALKPVLGGNLQTDLTTYFEAGAALVTEAVITDFVGPSLALEPLLAPGLIVENERKLSLHGTPVLCGETLSLCTVQDLAFPS